MKSLDECQKAWASAVLRCVPPQNVLAGAVDLLRRLCGCPLRRPMGTSLVGVAAAALCLGIWGTHICTILVSTSSIPLPAASWGVASQGRNGHEAGVEHLGGVHGIVGGGRWRRQQVACPRPGIHLMDPKSQSTHRRGAVLRKSIQGVCWTACFPAMIGLDGSISTIQGEQGTLCLIRELN